MFSLLFSLFFSLFFLLPRLIPPGSRRRWSKLTVIDRFRVVTRRKQPQSIVPPNSGRSAYRSASGPVEIPRAFVCAESKIFDVSEWASCQGMECRPDTHGPTFHVNMVGLDKTGLRSNSSRYPWGLDAEMIV